uniref:TAA-related n=1 Tax=Marchantia polymorpha TaxID=3197 RepID=A0A0G3FLN6_MARPO|nr:TAA-related [Marchantia polymorpha]
MSPNMIDGRIMDEKKQHLLEAEDSNMIDGRIMDEKIQHLLEAEDSYAAEDYVTIRERITRVMLFSVVMWNFLQWIDSVKQSSLQPAGQLSGTETNSRWAHAAAEAAEGFAAYDCSGHGSVLLDTVPTNGEIVCECHACFTGPSCAESVPDCLAQIDSGDPVMYEYYWKQNAEAGTLVTPPWYRMSYREGMNMGTGCTLALEKQIRTLHKMVGNAAADGKILLVSSGSSPLLLSIMQALSYQKQASYSAVAAAPFYELYRRQTDYFGDNRFAWGGDAKLFAQDPGNAGKDAMEFVTYPNNPDFRTRQPTLNGSHAHIIYDFAYYWPHMSAITREFDEDIMTFTLSKVTGHAGTRIGWGLFKDPSLAALVQMMLVTNSLGVSHDAQARATQLLRAVTSTYLKDNGPVPFALPAAQYAKEGRIFHYGRAVLERRYKWLEQIFAASDRFSFLKHDPEYCAFFGQTLEPSPAYAWVYCNRKEDEDCYNLFLNAGISLYRGSAYGVTDRHVRFSLLKRDSDYEVMEKYLLKLVAA